MIVKVSGTRVRFENRLAIGSLTFETNFGRIHGPFGSSGAPGSGRSGVVESFLVSSQGSGEAVGVVPSAPPMVSIPPAGYPIGSVPPPNYGNNPYLPNMYPQQPLPSYSNPGMRNGPGIRRIVGLKRITGKGTGQI